MMQNSLERLFDGLAASLRDTVAPAVADPYAKAQVLAAVELLNNLASRVEWRRDQILAEIEAARRVLAAAGVEAPAFDPAQQLSEARAAHLAAVVALPPGVATAERRAFVHDQLEAELSRLRTGMYRRPGRAGP